MISGRAVGFIILSLLFGYFVQRSSYSIIFIIVGLLMLIPIIFTVFAREPDKSQAEEKFDWKAFSLLLKPVFLIFAIYAILYSIVSFGVDGLITYYMSNQLDAQEVSIGHFGALRGAGAVIGALIGGLLMERVGYKRMAIATVFVISIAAALMGLSSTVPMILKLALIWGFAWGLQETVFLCLAMSLADVRIAASIFAIMMAISNIGTAIVEGVATALSAKIGFQLVFLALAGFNFINIAILILYFRIWKPAT